MGSASEGNVRTAGVSVEERSAVAWRILFVIIASTLGVASLTLLEPRNPPLVTVLFHGTLLAIMAAVAWGLRQGHVNLAGWALALAFFGGTLAATVLNSGFLPGAGTSYIISVLVAAATVGRRAALVLAGLSIAGVSAVAWAAALNLLPPPVIAQHSVTNSWISVALPLALCGYLLHVTLRQHQQALVAAAARERERDQAQSELLQSQKLEVVGRLGAGLAHDFNNLLTVIVGSAELLRADEHRDQEEVESIIEAADRGALLTSRLLAFGRPQPPKPTAQSVARALEEFLPLLQRLAGDEVEVTLESIPAGNVKIDPIALEQILLNLVINAKEAIAGSGRIVIQATRDDSSLILRVQDTGPGVPDDRKERIFEPFFTSKGTGTGLGLATVRALVKQAGGTVTLCPAPSGACFEIRLPLTQDLAPESGPPRTQSLPTGLKTLLVDDDESVLEVTAAGLRALGWEVAVAPDGMAAISRLERAEFDLVVTDNAMHGMSGLELTHQIRNKFPDLPILLVSGNPVDTALPAKVHFLAKPYGHRQLAAAVGALLLTEAGSPQMALNG